MSEFFTIPEKYDKVSERKFLKDFVLTQFNFQMQLRGHSAMLDDNCTIKSITPAPNYRVAYEISTERLNDYLRVQVHFNFDLSDSLLPFRTKNEAPYTEASLQDEVWETTGTIDTAHFDFTNYTFRLLVDDGPQVPVLTSARHAPLRFKNGAYIALKRKLP